MKYKVIIEENNTTNINADLLTDKFLQMEDLDKKTTELLNLHGLIGKHLCKRAPVCLKWLFYNQEKDKIYLWIQQARVVDSISQEDNSWIQMTFCIISEEVAHNWS